MRKAEDEALKLIWFIITPLKPAKRLEKAVEAEVESIAAASLLF